MAAVTICSDFGAPKNKDLDYCDIKWFALETNRDHSVIFEIASKYFAQGKAILFCKVEEPCY